MAYILAGTAGIISGGLISACVEMTGEHAWKGKGFLYVFFQHVEHVITGIFLALAYILMYTRFGFSARFLTYMTLCLVLSWISLLDVQGRKIPNGLLVIGMVSGFILSFINPEMTPENAFSGFVAAGATIWLVSFITGGGISFGDIKVFSCMGMFLGFKLALSSLFITAFLSGMAGIIMLALHVKSRKDAMPITPFILICSIFVVLFS